MNLGHGHFVTSYLGRFATWTRDRRTQLSVTAICLPMTSNLGHSKFVISDLGQFVTWIWCFCALQSVAAVCPLMTSNLGHSKFVTSHLGQFAAWTRAYNRRRWMTTADCDVSLTTVECQTLIWTSEPPHGDPSSTSSSAARLHQILPRTINTLPSIHQSVWTVSGSNVATAYLETAGGGGYPSKFFLPPRNLTNTILIAMYSNVSSYPQICSSSPAEKSPQNVSGYVSAINVSSGGFRLGPGHSPPNIAQPPNF